MDQTPERSVDPEPRARQVTRRLARGRQPRWRILTAPCSRVDLEPVDALVDPVEAGDRLLAERLDRAPVRVDLDAAVGEITIVDGDEVAGGCDVASGGCGVGPAAKDQDVRVENALIMGSCPTVWRFRSQPTEEPSCPAPESTTCWSPSTATPPASM
ncbi:MAG: hypothetical protein JNM77_03850 [Pseudonocardia sp.]|nr:hypothetical protein [Pseudonocardia sp.]